MLTLKSSLESTESTESVVSVNRRSVPRLWVVCSSFGEISETWIGRQVNGFARVEPAVVCWGVAKTAPAEVADVPKIVVPFPSRPHEGSGRWLFRLRHLPTGNFFGTIGREGQWLRQRMDADQPAAILCHAGHMALRMLPAAMERGVPLVAHFHGMDISSSLRNRWYRWSLRRYLKHFAAVVCVAEYQRSRLITMGVEPSKIHVIPCGVPTASFPPAAAVQHQPCRFLFVGRFVEKKAPLLAIRAFAECRTHVPGVCLTMIGGGPLLAAAEQLGRDLGLGESLRLLGPQPQAVVLQEFQKAGAFVLPCMTPASGDMEGWPVAIGEAMATGLPIVSTLHGEIPAQVKGGCAGLLASEGDAQAVSEAMLRLAMAPELRVTMGNAGRMRAISLFDSAVLTRRLEDVVLSVVR